MRAGEMLGVYAIVMSDTHNGNPKHITLEARALRTEMLSFLSAAKSLHYLPFAAYTPPPQTRSSLSLPRGCRRPVR